MIDGIRLKVCGITSLVDAEFADKCGADYLGFILYPKSPRFVALMQYRSIVARMSDRKKVAVSVEPTLDELAKWRDAGFDRFQIHFRPETDLATVAAWSEAVGASRLWLAPKLPAEVDVDPAWLPLADHFLLDTFHVAGFGGSGQTGDWAKFARHQTTHPEKTWILAGGLNSENVSDALRASGARFLDVNSGVEAAPGLKDHAKLKRLIVRLHEARTGDNGRSIDP